MTTKKKLSADPPFGNDEVQKSKANWNPRALGNFIDACLDQVTKGERVGTSFTKIGSKNIVGHGVGNKMIQEKFQHSGEIVSRHFHQVLRVCLKLSFKYIKHEDPMFRDCHTKIQNDQRYCPFFKNAIGAIDGTHVSCVVNVSEQPRFIGRKGYPSLNVMVVCDWNMRFTLVLAGWEGTVHDARIFDQALTNKNLNFPYPPSDVNVIIFLILGVLADLQIIMKYSIITTQV